MLVYAGTGCEFTETGMDEFMQSRRSFVKRAAYMTPAVLTLAAAPEFAKAGSIKDDKDKDKKPKKDK